MIILLTADVADQMFSDNQLFCLCQKGFCDCDVWMHDLQFSSRSPV